MKWVLDHLWTLLIIAGVIAQLLQAIRGKKDGAAPDASAGPAADEFEDPVLAERTRRIRAEIQRRIAERAGAGRVAPAPVAEARPFLPPPVEQEMPELLPPQRRPEVSAYAPAPDRRQAEMLEQQAALAEQLAQLQTMKTGATRRQAFEARVDAAAHPTPVARQALLAELGDPAALRRAFILREVLGPPVALR